MTENADGTSNLDVLRKRQVDAWERGERIYVEALIADSTRALRDDEILELIFSEVMIRSEHGDRRGVEEYQSRFPQFGDSIERLFALQLAMEPSAEESGATVISSIDSTRPNHSLAAEPTDSDSADVKTSPQSSLSKESDASLTRTLGQYELLGELGEGGMGTVYKARHTSLDKLVAIKLLRGDFMRTAQAVTRFKREMKAVGKIDHPNIVRAMDAGEINGTHYLAMELVEGTDLHKIVKQRGPLSVSDACTAIRQAALGLEAAHQGGLVHRDIKPSNLLLSKYGQIKILDLGLALVGDDGTPHEAVTSTGQVLGTPDYMAPEQWEDTHRADPRTDLYALGCTLFYLLTGRAPYATDENKSVMKKMAAHGNAPIPDVKAARARRLSKLHQKTEKEVTDVGVRATSVQDVRATSIDRVHATSDISDELNAIYLRLMAKCPEDRYHSAGELARALAPFATSNVDKSRSPQATEYKHDAPASGLFATTVTHISNGESLPVASAGKNKFGRLVGAASLLVLGLMIILVLKHGAKPTIEHHDRRQTLTAEPKHDAPASGLLTSSDTSASDSDRVDFAAERKAAQSLLELKKGIVSLSDGQTTWTMTDSIPTKPFFISSVQLAASDMTDEQVVMLAGCRGLQELRLPHNPQLTSAGLKAIGTLPRLEILDLTESACAEESLDFVANYPRLKTLLIAGGGSKKLLETLPPCPHLTTLHTPWAVGSVGKRGLQTIARQCPALTQLILNDSTVESLTPLSDLRKLQDLFCFRTELDAASVAALATLPDFVTLRVESPDPACIELLAPLCEKLHEFAMRDQGTYGAPALTDAKDWRRITRFPNLKKITIDAAIAVDADSLLALATMPRLMLFEVGGNLNAADRQVFRRFTEEDLAALRKARPDVELSIDGQLYPAMVKSNTEDDTN